MNGPKYPVFDRITIRGISPPNPSAPTINGCLSRQHNDDQLQRLESGLQVSEHRLDLIGPGRVLAEARLAYDGHAGVVGDLLQLLGEVPEGVLAHGPLGREARYRPYPYLDAGEELLAAHVPDALVRHGLLFALRTLRGLVGTT